MADKDVGVGWGTLPADLMQWRCPQCTNVSDVNLWKQVSVVINQRKLDGRECPMCHKAMATIGCTEASLLTQPKTAPKRSHKKKVAPVG